VPTPGHPAALRSDREIRYLAKLPADVDVQQKDDARLGKSASHGRFAGPADSFHWNTASAAIESRHDFTKDESAFRFQNIQTSTSQNDTPCGYQFGYPQNEH